MEHSTPLLNKSARLADLRHLASEVRTVAYPSAPSREQYLEAVKSSRKAHNTRVDSEARWEMLVLDAGVLERLKLTCLLVGDAETWRAQGVTVREACS